MLFFFFWGGGGGYGWSVFVVHHLVSIFANILQGKKKSGCFTLIEFNCHFNVNVLCLFLVVLWVGVQCVILAFPSHTHLLFHVICLVQF